MNVHRIAPALVSLGWLLAGSAAPIEAQEKDTVIEGQVKLGVHKFKLESGNLYQFEVKAKGFNPNVVLLGHFIPNTADFIKERNTFRALFFPPKNGEYTLAIGASIGFDAPKGELLDYTLTLKTMKLDEKPLLKKEDKITADDPRYAAAFRKTRHKAFPITMTKGKTYIIDMVRAGADNKLDPYLYIENPMKQIIAQDDDGGGFPNARILLRAQADGEYRIIASGLSDLSGLGDFTLTVRTVKDEK